MQRFVFTVEWIHVNQKDVYHKQPAEVCVQQYMCFRALQKLQQDTGLCVDNAAFSVFMDTALFLMFEHTFNIY